MTLREQKDLDGKRLRGLLRGYIREAESLLKLGVVQEAASTDQVMIGAVDLPGYSEAEFLRQAVATIKKWLGGDHEPDLTNAATAGLPELAHAVYLIGAITFATETNRLFFKANSPGTNEKQVVERLERIQIVRQLSQTIDWTSGYSTKLGPLLRRLNAELERRGLRTIGSKTLRADLKSIGIVTKARQTATQRAD